jgi:hypothetical protein
MQEMHWAHAHRLDRLLDWHRLIGAHLERIGARYPATDQPQMRYHPSAELRGSHAGGRQMRTSSFAHRLTRVAIVIACWLAAVISNGPAHAADRLRRIEAPAAAPTSSPASSGTSSAGRPATPGEAARFAERERQDSSLAQFEGGARISTTTLIIILLLVIILLILL